MTTESRLRKTEDTITQRLDRLFDKRQQLQVYNVDRGGWIRILGCGVDVGSMSDGV